ncbi:hypothetical protein, partial [Streptomyces sp. NPDC006459]|uniref:hypothetical protein n=1 Tax=Streptomyces sp. NPDC006459 TaxID=3154303 RepID=UPI0033AAE2F1
EARVRAEPGARRSRVSRGAAPDPAPQTPARLNRPTAAAPPRGTARTARTPRTTRTAEETYP